MSKTLQDRINENSERSFPTLVLLNFLCFVGMGVAAGFGSVPWCIFASAAMLSIDIDLLKSDLRRHHKESLSARKSGVSQ